MEGKSHFYLQFHELAQVLVFLVLFMTAVCFGSLIGFARVLANYRTVLNSPYSTVSALDAPAFLLALGWALRQIGFQWLKSVTSPDEEAPLLKVPLLQEVNSRECAINIDIVSNMFMAELLTYDLVSEVNLIVALKYTNH